MGLLSMRGIKAIGQIGRNIHDRQVGREWQVPVACNATAQQGAVLRLRL
ncbi:hypothetical protein P775_24465 [Puniceibacterium antarcticum]|uniref:Uncharacterized protein n=1 Tax=Puniceibacterium antarcticum TaxID=1206336 RepID=A0A2G8R747_9RHOB|nr:hypothetical protein P775_24465 [Puniceibacterium antarcticum]